MTKPTFILFFGAGWSGTTSLYYTLTRNQKYLHTGLLKEDLYLHNTIEPNIDKSDLEHWQNSSLKYYSVSEEVYNEMSEDNIHHEYLKHALKISYDKLYHYYSNPTLENYIDYKLEIVKNTNTEYVSVGDFSNINSKLLKSDNIFDIKKSLSEHFDVKTLMIFRDPIRRAFSQVNTALYMVKHIAITDLRKNGFRSPNAFAKPDNYKIIGNENLIKNTGINEFSNRLFDYVSQVNRAKEVFGEENTCYLIMEEFFDATNGRKEVSKLENYIGYSLPNIYPCAYVPDMGINAPAIPYLTDQSCSDWEVLTEDFYNEVKNVGQRVYDDFENMHGSLPTTWGSPINYES